MMVDNEETKKKPANPDAFYYRWPRLWKATGINQFNNIFRRRKIRHHGPIDSEKGPSSYYYLYKKKAIEMHEQRKKQLRDLESTPDHQQNYFKIEGTIKPDITRQVIGLGPYTDYDTADQEVKYATQGTRAFNRVNGDPQPQWERIDMEIPVSEDHTRKAVIPWVIPIPPAKVIRYPDGHICRRIRYFGHKDEWYMDKFQEKIDELRSNADKIYAAIRATVPAAGNNPPRQQPHDIRIHVTDLNGRNQNVVFSFRTYPHDFRNSAEVEKVSRVAGYKIEGMKLAYKRLFIGITNREKAFRSFLRKTRDKTKELETMWQKDMMPHAPHEERYARFVHRYYVVSPEISSPSPDGNVPLTRLGDAADWPDGLKERDQELIDAGFNPPQYVGDFPTQGYEVAPGYDENGMPLEVDPDTREVVVDKWREEFVDKKGNQVPDEYRQGVRKVPKEFIKKWNIISAVDQINNEWDELRDCIRDGRYFPGAPTIADHLIRETKRIGRETEKSKDGQFTMGLYINDGSGLPLMPSNKYRLFGQRDPSNLLPSFHLKGLNDKSYVYPGKFYYYDWPDQVLGLPSEPNFREFKDVPDRFVSSRGVDMFLVSSVLFEEVKVSDMDEALDRVGELDFGPRFFGQAYNTEVLDWASKASELNKKFTEADEEADAAFEATIESDPTNAGSKEYADMINLWNLKGPYERLSSTKKALSKFEMREIEHFSD